MPQIFHSREFTGTTSRNYSTRTTGSPCLKSLTLEGSLEQPLGTTQQEPLGFMPQIFHSGKFTGSTSRNYSTRTTGLHASNLSLCMKSSLELLPGTQQEPIGLHSLNLSPPCLETSFGLSPGITQPGGQTGMHSANIKHSSTKQQWLPYVFRVVSLLSRAYVLTSFNTGIIGTGIITVFTFSWYHGITKSGTFCTCRILE